MKEKDNRVIPGFSAVQMKRELQDQFQQKTSGMTFAELRQFLDEALKSLPLEKLAKKKQHPK